jgi:hypothetical protein
MSSIGAPDASSRGFPRACSRTDGARAEMNRADEHLGHARDVIESLASSGDDALLQLCARLVCKREPHDVARQKPSRCTGRKQLHHAARDDFCLAGARASDELEAATTVGDGLLLSDREFHATAPSLPILCPGDGSISRSTATFRVPGASPGRLRPTPRTTEMAGNTRNLLARSERFELPTPRFEVWCSIQLSYERHSADAAAYSAAANLEEPPRVL